LDGGVAAATEALAPHMGGENAQYLQQTLLLSDGNTLILTAQMEGVDWTKTEFGKFGAGNDTDGKSALLAASIGQNGDAYTVIKFTVDGIGLDSLDPNAAQPSTTGASSASLEQFKTTMQKVLDGGVAAATKALAPHMAGQTGQYLEQGLLLSDGATLILTAQVEKVDWTKTGFGKFGAGTDTDGKSALLLASIGQNSGSYTVIKVTVDGIGLDQVN
jgi:hypothetical protein